MDKQRVEHLACRRFVVSERGVNYSVLNIAMETPIYDRVMKFSDNIMKAIYVLFYTAPFRNDNVSLRFLE
jgi:hypothetical protein